MVSKSKIKTTGKKSSLKLILISISVIILFVTWNMEPQVDTLGARLAFRSSVPHDLFGPFATWYFGSIGNELFSWSQQARIIQLLLTTISGLLLLDIDRWKRKRTLVILCIALLYSSNVNRDAFSLAFVLLGFALTLFCASKRKFRWTKLLLIIAGLSILIGSLMRPYFSFLSIPILFLILESLRFAQKLIALVTLTLLPLLINGFIAEKYELSKSFPSQQPIAQDLTYFACQTNNIIIQEQAFRVLKIANADLVPSKLCALSSIHSGFLISGDPWKGVSPAFTLFQEEQEREYAQFRNGYVGVVLSRPDLFLKLKLHNLIEVVSAKGQMQHFNALHKNPNDYIRNLALLLQFFDKIGLFSPLFFLLIIICSKFLKVWPKENTLTRDTSFQIATISLFCFSLIYVGAIGRYTYISSILLGLLCVQIPGKFKGFVR